MIYNLVHTTRFCNSLHQVRSNLKSLKAKKTKGYEQDRHSRLRSPLREKNLNETMEKTVISKGLS